MPSDPLFRYTMLALAFVLAAVVLRVLHAAKPVAGPARWGLSAAVFGGLALTLRVALLARPINNDFVSTLCFLGGLGVLALGMMRLAAAPPREV